MDKKFLQWFVAERARALAMVLLTRRQDLVVSETKQDTGLDYSVTIRARDAIGNRPFGIYMGASMAPVATLSEANQQLKPVLDKARSAGPFFFPVCIFYFTVKDSQGYYSWAYEPVVPAEGQLRLAANERPACRKLGDEGLDEIVALVNRWYDRFSATMNSSEHMEQVEDNANPKFAALADEFETRVRGAHLSATTEVTLVYQCVDEEGRDLPPLRVPIVPQTAVSGFGANGPTFAASVHLEAILGNINSLVRHAPTGLVNLKDAPQVPLQIVGFELEINDVDNRSKRQKRFKARQP
jgi:hypothetical protein